MQTNSCGYSDTITVENPTDFILHNELSHDFTIQTDSRSEAEIYIITLASSITVFDDYTMTTQTEFSAQAELIVTVVDPCLSAEIPNLVLEDLRVNVHSGPS